MSKDSSTAVKRTSPASYLWIAAIAAVIGFAAVYWTMAPSDNGEGIANSPTAAEVKPMAAPTNTGETAAPTPNAMPNEGGKLNSGHMAAFIFKPEPEPLGDVSFKDGTGQSLTLADFKGKTILLNLWATWCAPCREETPALDRLQNQLGSDKFEVVALSVDRGGAEKSQQFLDKINVQSLTLYVDEKAGSSSVLKVIGMPTTLLIDADGREIGRLVGPAEWDSADAVRLIKAHLP
ncbi:Thiol-disulfide isomerase or thioredoxin [Filomicrobium insigne]|uniref:Thiol-disulfide isomerase or thioredoxin n=1 Tax=Filomicrobium insigne TaxID=418854 RepID=A0A1H0IHP8_9HYPH|nr:TlpA disulfide reductase family protein [Filomicrobium insigne]SDO30999.1 Thiol-disulfide isomerase or thioredoxin [Filomicrobium insigne]